MSRGRIKRTQAPSGLRGVVPVRGRKDTLRRIIERRGFGERAQGYNRRQQLTGHHAGERTQGYPRREEGRPVVATSLYSFYSPSGLSSGLTFVGLPVSFRAHCPYSLSSGFLPVPFQETRQAQTIRQALGPWRVRSSVNGLSSVDVLVPPNPRGALGLRSTRANGPHSSCG